MHVSVGGGARELSSDKGTCGAEGTRRGYKCTYCFDYCYVANISKWYMTGSRYYVINSFKRTPAVIYILFIHEHTFICGDFHWHNNILMYTHFISCLLCDMAFKYYKRTKSIIILSLDVNSIE